MAPKNKKLKGARKASPSTTHQDPGSPGAAPVGDGPGPVYFWRESHPSTGFLSNWYHGPEFVDPDESPRKVYRTCEHYMMHHKALLFGDHETAAQILDTRHPRAVKGLGPKVRGFSELRWLEHRCRVIERGLYCKFSYPLVVSEEGAERGEEEEQKEGSHPEPRTWKLGQGVEAVQLRSPSFRDALTETGARELVEASPFDRIWGIGFTAETAPADRNSWGENLLGKALMAVRQRFNEEAEDEKGKTP